VNATVQGLLVPLDGSDEATCSVAVALRLAEAIGAEVLASAGVADALATLRGTDSDAVVCTATRARPRFGCTWLGDVAESVLRNVSCPVILVGPRCTTSWRTDGPIVVALDGSSAALAALDVAVEWGGRLGVGVVAVHVAHPLETDLAPARVLEDAVRRHPDAELRTRLLRSREPEWEVVDFAEQVGASLVVCSTRACSGVSRTVLGRVAMGIVRRAHCPVLVRRPTTGDVPQRSAS